MTCIVGMVDEGRVWIGGDSHVAANCQRYPNTPLERKVFLRGDMAIGVTGASRMSQLLEHVLEIPEHPDGLATFLYLVTVLMPAIRAMVVAQDGVGINTPQDGWEFLLGYRGGLYSVCHDLSVSHLPVYGAVGCGREYAAGSLYTTHRDSNDFVRFPARDRVILALQAAAELDVHVAPPFIIESVG